ncbi:unnamed protein product [Phytophthora fragariaefolia]|uniref:Unnamed protein product n=1 Tax=Phytophthora fragariaefolia TaxID=1490495 RepID=A0A9W6TRE4_9STRA|nr:unnamed protein product [Phytophthora fragariaefolia]
MDQILDQKLSGNLSPLARAQTRALCALRVGTPSSAASPETSVSIKAPPVTSPGTGGGSPSRSPRAGAAEVSVPSSSFTGSSFFGSTGDASGGASESFSTPPGAALSPTLGATPRSAADAPEASSAVPGASRFSSVR